MTASEICMIHDSTYLVILRKPVRQRVRSTTDTSIYDYHLTSNTRRSDFGHLNDDENYI